MDFNSSGRIVLSGVGSLFFFSFCLGHAITDRRRQFAYPEEVVINGRTMPAGQLIFPPFSLPPCLVRAGSQAEAM